jgi:hypothetical protein
MQARDSRAELHQDPDGMWRFGEIEKARGGGGGGFAVEECVIMDGVWSGVFIHITAGGNV